MDKEQYRTDEYDKWAEFRTANQPDQNKKKKKRKKGIIICLVIIAAFAAGLGIFAAAGSDPSEPGYNLNTEHFAQINITGTIDNSGSSAIYETSSYDQEWLLGMIESTAKEPMNRGIILYLDTPGGSVYATDEVYLALLDYKEKTGNPIYAVMGPTCASGGYYISCAADKIYANRNTMTGSIGVTLGTYVDISGLLEKFDIETTTITAGDNKAMGSYFDPMTEEQIAIYQSIVDESYAQFTGIVAQGRGLDIETVKKLADGRLYTSDQAKDAGLIDEVMNYDDSLLAIQKETGLEGCPVYIYEYAPDTSIYHFLFSMADAMTKNESNDSDLAAALKMAEGNSLKPYYLAQ
ncbi:MAG: signal peptide peptidase SppA [Firmicutes bacterium]|nr:signal peptide peptidase SppA [Bacillota bacterium]